VCAPLGHIDTQPHLEQCAGTFDPGSIEAARHGAAVSVFTRDVTPGASHDAA
jgi:hypothetical protein